MGGCLVLCLEVGEHHLLSHALSVLNVLFDHNNRCDRRSEQLKDGGNQRAVRGHHQVCLVGSVREIGFGSDVDCRVRVLVEAVHRISARLKVEVIDV